MAHSGARCLPSRCGLGDRPSAQVAAVCSDFRLEQVLTRRPCPLRLWPPNGASRQPQCALAPLTDDFRYAAACYSSKPWWWAERSVGPAASLEDHINRWGGDLLSEALRAQSRSDVTRSEYCRVLLDDARTDPASALRCASFPGVRHSLGLNPCVPDVQHEHAFA